MRSDQLSGHPFFCHPTWGVLDAIYLFPFNAKKVKKVKKVIRNSVEALGGAIRQIGIRKGLMKMPLPIGLNVSGIVDL